MSISLKELRDQITLDADIRSDPNFGIVRLNRIINLAQRYVQAQLNGLGYKRWETFSSLSTAAGNLIASTFAGANIIKFGINELPNMLESPKSIPFIEVNDGSNYGVAYPVDANRFKDQVVNTYFLATMLDPSFTRLANSILITPVSVIEATVYYYKMIKDLTDATISITGASSTNGVTTVIATNHGLATGDIVNINNIVGMTDLNNEFQVNVTASNTFTVPLTSSQTYGSGGDITINSQIPPEVEDFIIRKAVLDIMADKGKIVDKVNAMKELDNDLTTIFQKFYGTVQNENFNQQVQNSKMQ